LSHELGKCISVHVEYGLTKVVRTGVVGNAMRQAGFAVEYEEVTSLEVASLQKEIVFDEKVCRVKWEHQRSESDIDCE